MLHRRKLRRFLRHPQTRSVYVTKEQKTQLYERPVYWSRTFVTSSFTFKLCQGKPLLLHILSSEVRKGKCSRSLSLDIPATISLSRIVLLNRLSWLHHIFAAEWFSYDTRLTKNSRHTIPVPKLWAMAETLRTILPQSSTSAKSGTSFHKEGNSFW